MKMLVMWITLLFDTQDTVDTSITNGCYYVDNLSFIHNLIQKGCG